MLKHFTEKKLRRQWRTNMIFATNALHFNGATSTLTITNSATTFNFTNNPFTVNMWVEPESRQYDCLIQNGGVTNGWYVNLAALDVIFGSATPSSSTSISTYKAGGAVIQYWTMVTCVWDGTNGYIFKNGSQVQTVGRLSVPASSSYNLVMGMDFIGTNQLDGDIWLPQVWSGALKASDIATLYFQQCNGQRWP